MLRGLTRAGIGAIDGGAVSRRSKVFGRNLTSSRRNELFV